MLARTAIVAGALAAVIAIAGCKIVKTEEKSAAAGDGVEIFFDDASFDPAKMVQEIWQPKVVPYLDGKAGAFAEVRALMRQDLDAAGARFGHRAQGEGTPWSIVIRAEGRIVEANTQSRAATVDVDSDGDGLADLKVQIGPVIRGTALRDSLDFVSFNDFRNQIDFASFGKALNKHAYETALSAVPREDLVGRDVALAGVFSLADPDKQPLVTAYVLALEE